MEKVILSPAFGNLRFLIPKTFIYLRGHDRKDIDP